MSADLALLRTTRFGPAEAALAVRLEAVFGPGNVVICADESRGRVETGLWPKASLTRARAEALAGGPVPADWGWRMGDLCHLAVAEAFGPRPRQWLIENDVHLPQDAAAAFARMAATEADFMACDLAPRPVKPIAEAMTAVLPRADWGCIFAFNRLNGARIPELRALRRALVLALQGTRRKMPNDEAVLANLGAVRGWKMVDLYAALPDVFDKAWFATNPPMLREAWAQTEGRIAHPVLSHDEVMERIRGGSASGHPQPYSEGRLRRVLAALPPEQAQALRFALSGKAENI